MHIPPHKYIENGNMTHSVTITGPTLHTLTQERVSFRASWTSTSTPIGTFTIEGTDDPRAAEDKQNGTSLAAWTTLSIPVGSCSGTDITVGSASIVTAGAGGSFALDLAHPFAFTRLKYVSTSGGTTNQLQVTVSGTGK